jgi:hypothetical protein
MILRPPLMDDLIDELSLQCNPTNLIQTIYNAAPGGGVGLQTPCIIWVYIYSLYSSMQINILLLTEECWSHFYA